MIFPIVFFDLAGPDTAALRSFYSSVFGWTADHVGNLSVPAMAPLKGTIRVGDAEKRIYIGVPDVSAILEKVKSSGGSIDTPRFEVPGVVVLGLFKDPAGNPMGLVEMIGNAPRIP